MTLLDNLKIMSKNYGVLASSVDPKQLSATVSGLIIALSSTIILVAQHYNVALADSDVATIAQQAGLVVGLLYTLYGAIRKFVVYINNKIQNRIQG